MMLTFFNQLSNVRFVSSHGSEYDVTPYSLVGTSSYKPSEGLGTSVFWVKEHPEDGGSRLLRNIIFVNYNQLICTISCIYTYCAFS
jgi:hypothetical protein